MSGDNLFIPVRRASDARPQSELTPPPSDADGGVSEALKLNELIKGGAAAPALQAWALVIPATITSYLVRLPYVYDYITFWFPTAPGSPIRFGPQAPTVAVAAAAVITLPGTAREYQFDNPNAAYTVNVFGVRGLPPVDIHI